MLRQGVLRFGNQWLGPVCGMSLTEPNVGRLLPSLSPESVSALVKTVAKTAFVTACAMGQEKEEGPWHRSLGKQKQPSFLAPLKLSGCCFPIFMTNIKPSAFANKPKFKNLSLQEEKLEKKILSSVALPPR